MAHLDLRVSPSGSTPIYRQLMEQITNLVASDQLSPGQRLPSVRRLAEQLVINPNTVARAYRQLEAVGTVDTRRGSGVFVSDPGAPLSTRHRQQVLAERVDALLVHARQLGVDDPELMEMIERRRILLATGTER